MLNDVNSLIQHINMLKTLNLPHMTELTSGEFDWAAAAKAYQIQQTIDKVFKFMTPEQVELIASGQVDFNEHYN